MSEHKTIRRQKFVIFGMAVALVFAVIGVGVAQANVGPPATIHTCSKNTSGATKIKAVCTSKFTAKTWADSGYRQIMFDSQNTSASRSYAGFNFSNMDLPIFGVSQGNFTHANFAFSVMSYGSASYWDNDNFSGATFTNTYLKSASLVNSDFNGANLTDADLSNADLYSATFQGATMTGVTYDNTICPNGTNSNDDSGTCAFQGNGL